jgi:hypothetical protein
MPTSQSVHIDSALSRFSVGVMERAGRVFGSFFPITPVDHASNKYHVIARNPFLRGDSQPLGPGKESAGHDFTLSSDNYNCVEYGEHADVFTSDLNNADFPMMIEQGASRLATTNLLLTHEQRFASGYFKTGVWGTDLTVANKWDSYGTSDPITDIETAIETVLLNGGRPDGALLKLLLGYRVWKYVKNHPLIIDRVRAGGSSDAPARVTKQAFAELFGLDEVVVSDAVQATNADGVTEAYDFIFGKHALLAFVGQNGEGDFMASAGRLFAYKGVNQGQVNQETVQIQIFDQSLAHLHKVRYEARMAVDFKVVRSFPDGGLNLKPGDMVPAELIPNARFLDPLFVRRVTSEQAPGTSTPTPPAKGARRTA